MSAKKVDELVPDPEVWDELGISSMSGWRWSRDPALSALGFPPPIKIRGRNFRSRRLLEQFKQRLLTEALTRKKSSGKAA